jgi:DNA-binding transcriptional regulator of glucitol operon
VWRVALSPRWLLWHLLALLAVAGCVVAAIWQWDRAGSAMGSALNVGYGIQWPIFAGFFLYMWWRFLRNDLVAYREQQPVIVEEPIAVAENPWDREANPFTRTPMRTAELTETESPALLEYNKLLAGLAEDQDGGRVRSDP